MDLKIGDVAELLNVSEEAVHKWLASGEIPAYRLNREYRFSRSEIEDWILKQKLEPEKQHSHSEPKNMQHALYRALYRGDVLSIDATTKEELIEKTMEEMGNRFDLDPAVLTELFLDREQMMSTGLGKGIAVPHTRDFLLDTHFDVVMTVYPTEPIEYQSIDRKPVDTLFFLFASDDRHHLNLLAKIAHLASDVSAQALMKRRPSKEQLLSFVKSWETDSH